jgi:hypothetical protein
VDGAGLRFSRAGAQARVDGIASGRGMEDEGSGVAMLCLATHRHKGRGVKPRASRAGGQGAAAARVREDLPCVL